MVWLESILKRFFDLSLNFLLPCVVTTALLLFLPSSIIEKFGANPLLNTWRPIIGLLFLHSFVCILYKICSHLALIIGDWCNKRKTTKRLEKTLENMPASELGVLANFVKSNSSDVIWLPMNNPEVISLRNKGHIYIASNVGEFRSEFMDYCHAYSMHPQVKKIINRESSRYQEAQQQTSKNNTKGIS